MAASNKYGVVLGVRRGKSIQQEDKTQDTELAIQQARKWIEVSKTCNCFSNSFILIIRNVQIHFSQMFHLES